MVTHKPDWISSHSLLELTLQASSSMERLEHLLARPYANRSLPFDVRQEEVMSWLNIGEELDSIKNSNWVEVREPHVRSLLNILAGS